jgi:hypothetical protein
LERNLPSPVSRILYQSIEAVNKILLLLVKSSGNLTVIKKSKNHQGVNFKMGVKASGKLAFDKVMVSYSL